MAAFPLAAGTGSCIAPTILRKTVKLHGSTLKHSWLMDGGQIDNYVSRYDISLLFPFGVPVFHRPPILTRYEEEFFRHAASASAFFILGGAMGDTANHCRTGTSPGRF